MLNFNSLWFVAKFLIHCTKHLLQELFNSVAELPNSVAQFVRITDKQLRQQSEKYFMWDQLAAACVINPAVICESRNVSASVELHGSDTRGQMVVDWNRSPGKTDNVCVVTKINQALYEKLITAAFNFYSSGTFLS